MAIRFYFFPFIFFVTNLISYKSLHRVKSKPILINSIEMKFCHISYVEIDGTLFLVKQKKDPDKQLSVIRDALAAWIAEPLDIAHKVTIISSSEDFPGKVNYFFPATLHTLAGKTVREQKGNKFSGLRLRQFWKKGISFSERGLTRAIINHMSWHKQLPIIVALDLFIGNSDRHCGNLCYDVNTDSFCAIDMDDTFNKDLCLFAYNRLKEILKEENNSFSAEEIESLIILRKTMNFLINKYRADTVVNKLRYFAKQAGFVKGNSLYTDKIKRKINLYERTIRNSYQSAVKLVFLLDKIIISYKKKLYEH